MNTSETTNYENVIQLIHTWSPARRFSLVQDILNSLAPNLAPSPPRTKSTLQEALGLLATDRPAPSDAEVQQWLEERRMGKYA